MLRGPRYVATLSTPLLCAHSKNRMLRHHLPLVVLLVCGLGTPSLARAQAEAAKATAAAARATPRDVSALLHDVRAKGEVPGLVGAIVRGRNLVAIGADGVRKRGDPTPIMIDDRMHLGSCTKAMTATLAARLVEQGKLDWKTKLADVFPKVEMQPAWRDVTLELLLTNRSGAPAELDAGGLWTKLWKHQGTAADARQLLLEGVVSREPAAPPGTKFLYSNAGFAIAGHMLETIARKPWEELMQSELFEPLHITSAGFGAPGTKGKLDQPLGHNGLAPMEVGPGADNPVAIGPAGIVNMSIADWGKFVSLHLCGERGDAQLLKAETFTKLHAVPAGADNEYAMGWGVAQRPWADGRVLTHSGSNTMWFCVTWLAPKKDFAVLVCCNQGGDAAAKTCDAAAWALIQDELAATTADGK